MDMVWGDIPPDDVYTISFAYLAYQIPCSYSYVAREYWFPVFGDPHDMVLVIKFGVGCSAIILHTTNYTEVMD